MSQSRNFSSLLNPSYLKENSVTSAAAAAAAAAAAVSAAIANGTPYTPPTLNKKRESDGKKKIMIMLYS